MVGNTVRDPQNISCRYMLNDDEIRRSIVALNITIFFVRVKTFSCRPVLGREISEGLFWGSFKVLQGCEMDTIFYVWYMKRLPQLKKRRCNKGKSLTSGCGLSV